MSLPPTEDAERVFQRAVDALKAGQTPSALALLERALKLKDDPSWYSYLGYCIAKERGQVRKGSDLCAESLKAEPENALHHLNLAKILVISGQKTEALGVLREGMAVGGSEELISLLGTLGTRKPPVLPFLSRDNSVNKYLGMILSKLRLR